jgi:hypothetical protein
MLIDLNLANLQRLIHGIRERWRQQGELAGLNKGELDKLAADLGLATSDLNHVISRGPNAADLLHRRLAVLGITRADVERTASGLARDLERACACCTHKRLCSHDLEGNPDDSGWQDYCPNAVALASVDSSHR